MNRLKLAAICGALITAGALGGYIAKPQPATAEIDINAINAVLAALGQRQDALDARLSNAENDITALQTGTGISPSTVRVLVPATDPAAPRTVTADSPTTPPSPSPVGPSGYGSNTQGSSQSGGQTTATSAVLRETDDPTQANRYHYFCQIYWSDGSDSIQDYGRYPDERNGWLHDQFDTQCQSNVGRTK